MLLGHKYISIIARKVGSHIVVPLVLREQHAPLYLVITLVLTTCPKHNILVQEMKRVMSCLLKALG